MAVAYCSLPFRVHPGSAWASGTKTDREAPAENVAGWGRGRAAWEPSLQEVAGHLCLLLVSQSKAVALFPGAGQPLSPLIWKEEDQAAPLAAPVATIIPFC